jgi:hypothetical protein
MWVKWIRRSNEGRSFTDSSLFYRIDVLIIRCKCCGYRGYRDSCDCRGCCGWCGCCVDSLDVLDVLDVVDTLDVVSVLDVVDSVSVVADNTLTEESLFNLDEKIYIY